MATQSGVRKVDRFLPLVDLIVDDRRPQKGAPRLEPSRGGSFFPKGKGAVSTIFPLDVARVDGILKRAIAAGAPIRDHVQAASAGGRMPFFFDPFGYIWGLQDMKPAAPSRGGLRRIARCGRQPMLTVVSG